MKLEPNKVRGKLNDGRIVAGSVIYSWSPEIMDQAGLAGLDYMRIDTEHGWRRDGAMEALIRAARAAGVEPILRVDGDDPFLVRKALEIGAGGVVVAHVNSVADARAAVSASKFPPRGVRGYGAACFSGGWGTLSGPGWSHWSDTEPMIGVMVESVEAVECVDEIMALDGLDFALFGPSDLSMSLGNGHPLPMSDERIEEPLKRIIAAAKKHGKHVSLTAGNKAGMMKYAAMGVSMLEVSSDVEAIRTAWTETVRTAGDLNAEA
ncbi:MAG: hypothetical protein HY521_09565 [Proteobacteria bacterium]|nr:hypothetical protein [Pseudomonadota bacterium]